MKRLCLILCLLLLCACGAAPSEDNHTVQLYFPTLEFSAQGAITPQSAPLEDLSLDSLLELYLSCAPDAAHRAAIPSGWQFQGAALEGSTAVVHFDGTACASAITRSLAYACLTQTLLQIEGVQELRIYSPNDPKGVLFAAGDFLLTDIRSDIQEEDFVLYLPDAEMRYLEPSIRTAPVMNTADKPAFLLSQLLESGRCLPEGTQLRSIRVDYGICTVDLSQEFVDAMPADFASERLAVYSIVNSLTELDTVVRVELYVEGSPLTHLKYLSFSGDLTRDETLLSPELRPTSLDANLYLVCSNSSLLVPIPCVIDTDPDTPTASILLQTLFAAQGRDGIMNVLPANLRILSLKVEDGTCVIDLTGEFLSTPARMQGLRLRSLIATVTALPEIERVELYVEGIEPDYATAELSELSMPDSDWFAE